jgi:F420-dependent methylenetetrahydromethanopterin dehydrogenase
MIMNRIKGADVNARNIKTGQTALMQVLQTDARQDERADKQDIIITLLNAGADLRLEDYTGKRIIRRSTLSYDLEVIK